MTGRKEYAAHARLNSSRIEFAIRSEAVEKRDRQNEIEAARSDAVASAIAGDSRSVLDANVREGARKLMSTVGGVSSATATSRLEAS